MATKTITLNGAEQRVDSLGGLNALIVNNTDEPLYASAKAGVVPYADGVTEIKAGDTRTILDTNGTVYLLGNGGRVELTGGINFNQPSRSSGGGGGVTPEEVNSIVTEKIAEVVANAPEDLDTLKEISDWIEGHEDSAAAMNSKINSNTADISDIRTEQETQDSDISALQTEMGQKANISEVSNPNLIDNWYFLNPVNQRGKTAGFASGEYTIDRWYSRMTIPEDTDVVTSEGIKFFGWENENGVKYNFQIAQVFEKDFFEEIVNKQVTLSFLTASGELGTVTEIISPTDTMEYIRATTTDLLAFLYRWGGSKGGLLQVLMGSRPRSDGTTHSDTITTIKLELGNHQTLARQDTDGKWILNDPPPNKALELLKCQRYYQIRSTGGINSVDLRPTMRVNPTIKQLDDGNYAYSADL